MITNSNNRTPMQELIYKVKLVSIGIIMASAVAGFLAYHMESKARDMERNQYQKELQALKALPGTQPVQNQ